MKAPRRRFNVGDRVPADAFFPHITCPSCQSTFAAFGVDLDGEVRCGCGRLLGEFRNQTRVK